MNRAKWKRLKKFIELDIKKHEEEVKKSALNMDYIELTFWDIRKGGLESVLRYMEQLEEGMNE